MPRITPFSETRFSMILPEDYPPEQDNVQQTPQQGRLSSLRPRFTPAGRSESCEDGSDFISIERRELYLLSSFAAAFCRALSAKRAKRQARPGMVHAEKPRSGAGAFYAAPESSFSGSKRPATASVRSNGEPGVVYAELLACYRRLMRFYDGKA
jgi:hypothetical protein